MDEEKFMNILAGKFFAKMKFNNTVNPLLTFTNCSCFVKWNYSITSTALRNKRYNTTKKISEEAIEQIKTAIQLAPSSYGLQLFEVLHIKDVALREQLKAVGTINHK